MRELRHDAGTRIRGMGRDMGIRGRTQEGSHVRWRQAGPDVRQGSCAAHCVQRSCPEFGERLLQSVEPTLLSFHTLSPFHTAGFRFPTFLDLCRVRRAFAPRFGHLDR